MRVGRYTLLGETIDDAAGEAFDKSAKLLGLGYPGGPALSALARQGRADAFVLPRPLLHKPNLDFSFAGLKTAVAVRLAPTRRRAQRRSNVPTWRPAFQAAIVDVLCAKSLRALQASGLQRLVVAGGVGANASLRQRLGEACRAYRRVRALPGAGAVHRQRRDDRAGRGHALAARPGR